MTPAAPPSNSSSTCSNRLPETTGLFELNTTLDFHFGAGRPIEVDLVARSLQLVIEIDGYYHFQDPKSYRRDRRKDLELQKRGYLVLRILAADVVGRLEELLETLPVGGRVLPASAGSEVDRT